MKKLPFVGVVAVVLLSAASAFAAGMSAQPYDLVIRNGRIIDGTGSPWYRADIAIRDGHIAAIGRFGKVAAKQVINAHGDVVAPGFIDMLDQSGLTLLADGHAQSKIYQGVTTLITGEGESVAPLDDRIIQENQSTYRSLHIKPSWHDLGGYFALLEKQGVGVNLGTYVGAASVREMVLGYGDRTPTPAQLKQMQALVARAMQQGAMGVSTALQYPPATYSKTPELVALAKVASRYGGIYASHMRSEGNAEMAALDEVFTIARKAHIPAEIFHLKAAGHKNWGNMPKIVAKIDAARAAGLDISADTYAYTAWGNDLASFIPPWAHAGGTADLLARLKNPKTRAKIIRGMQTPSDEWSNDWQEIPGPHAVEITSVGNPALKSIEGKRLDEIAKTWHEKPIDTLLDILIKDHAATGVAVFGMAQPDVTLALRQPWVSICDDAAATAPNPHQHPHPRAYATFPRIIHKYVREEHVLSLADAIRKMTALPAQRMGLTRRGVLKQGMWADIVVFAPAKLRGLATFQKPNQLAVGMDDVLVDGVPVIADGKMTGALPGKVLRGPGYSQTDSSNGSGK